MSDSYAAIAPSDSSSGKPLTAAEIENLTLDGNIDREPTVGEYVDRHTKETFVQHSRLCAHRSYPGFSERLIDTSLDSFAAESNFFSLFRHVFDEHYERFSAISLKSVAQGGLVGCASDEWTGRKKHHHKNVFNHDFLWAVENA